LVEGGWVEEIASNRRDLVAKAEVSVLNEGGDIEISGEKLGNDG